MNLTNRQKYMDAMNRRADLLAKADEAASAGNVEALKDFTAQAAAINPEIEGYQALMEQEARFAQAEPVGHDPEARDRAEARVEALRRKEAIKFDASEIMAGLGIRNSTTLATGNLIEPTRNGTGITDTLGAMSSIIDMVSVVDLTGATEYKETYLKTELTAYTGDVETKAGTARQASDPSFGVVSFGAYEASVTTFVDKNLSRLSPIAYEEKIRSLAMRALRRAVVDKIYHGDGKPTGNKMYGVLNGVDDDATPMTVAVSDLTIEAGFLDKLVFALGTDDELLGTARLFLTKAQLQAVGALRNQDDKRVYEIVPDAANPNTGRITEGGLIVPYCLASDLKNDGKMIYGQPAAYTLGLFGSYSIRLDESVKSIERMHTILGDVFIGGNVMTPGGFAVGTVTAAAEPGGGD